jgi:type I restriction enzyme S subunit
MKKGWTTKRIGDVCEVVNGGTPKTSVAEYWGGEHLWITPAEMGKRESPYADDTERKLTDSGLRDSSARMLPPYSVILSSRAPIGHLVINTKPMSTNQGCKSLIPSSQLEHKFLYYYLSSIVELLDSLGTGATFRELSGGKLKEVSVPVPPLAEQQRIVGVLDEAFAGLATAQAHAAQNLQNARALFESHLQSVFTHRGKGWVEKALGEVAEFKNGLNYTRDSKGQTLPVVGVGDFQSNNVVPMEQLQTATIDGELSSEYALQPGDILTVRSNGSKDLVGRCMLVPELSETTSYSGFIIRIRVNAAEVSPAFLLHFMKSSDTRDRLTRDGGGANISNINQTKLAALPVSLPPIAEQKKVVTQLDALAAETQRLTRLYEQKQAALAALKKSLLHQAFTGEL